jgi:hypothetical protein
VLHRDVGLGLGMRPSSVGPLNRSGFVGGSNFQIGWSPYELESHQVERVLRQAIFLEFHTLL